MNAFTTKVILQNKSNVSGIALTLRSFLQFHFAILRSLCFSQLYSAQIFEFGHNDSSYLLPSLLFESTEIGHGTEQIIETTRKLYFNYYCSLV